MGPILENITWYGGEVLFLENFQIIYDLLRPNSQLRQHIVTNGLLIDKVWAKKFTIDETHITYSIDAVDPKLYESIRRGASFTDLLKSLDLMNSARTKYSDSDLLSLNFVLMKSNLDQLPLLPKFLKNHRFSHLNIVPVTTLKPGDPENIFESSDKNLINKTDRLLKNLFRECQDLGIGIHEWYFQAQGDTTKDKTPEEKKKPICFKPWTKLQICEGGDVILEQFCIKPVGNVVNNMLLEIWNSSMIINYRENLLKKEAPEICNPTCFDQSENRYLNKY